MTKLKTVGPVDMYLDNEDSDRCESTSTYSNNVEKGIRLKSEFDWFLIDQFKELKKEGTKERVAERKTYMPTDNTVH